MRTFKNKLSLLDDIARGLKKHERHSVANLKASFFKEGECLLETSIAAAIDYLANDITFDEKGEWSEAAYIEIDTF